MKEYDLIIIGGGASGMLCAIYASKKNIKNILLIEKDPVLGGALTLGNYNISSENFMTGKEYKEKLLNEFESSDVEVKLGTMAIKIDDNNEIICTSEKEGIAKYKGRKIILANGAKETSRKAVNMVGDRCSGILTVGMAKKIFAMKDVIPGKNILIYGNDILYMLENELKEHNLKIVGIICDKGQQETFGLTDKIYEGYDICRIQGEGRIESVILCKGKEETEVKCDTLIFAKPMLSDGLVAKRSGIKLNMKTTGPAVDEEFATSKSNIFACGNGIYIHNSIEEIERGCKKVIESLS
ncbi:MAG: FAD-dependent oxidoreductase [Clostridium sp.]|uniref:NAD(P)/FAD-dependent oxidoreductase n=1 Tax=Clostridium sp. TaxID=1506 RepID=UPI002A850AD8|nr:FAD-dependent oxidoreductase [Clostridium sp.]MDY5098922.1 FAD-dependent oxidoreductase [Clostridium sp.]